MSQMEVLVLEAEPGFVVRESHEELGAASTEGNAPRGIIMGLLAAIIMFWVPLAALVLIVS